MLTSKPETGSAVAVNDTAAEPSVTEAEEKANVTIDGSLASKIVAVIAEPSIRVPLVGVPGVIMIVSSNSSFTSPVLTKLTVPSVCPAVITNSG